VKKIKVKVKYLLDAPQGTHGGKVGRVMVIGQLAILTMVELRPTHQKALMAPQLQKERTTEEDPMLSPTLGHGCTQPPIRNYNLVFLRISMKILVFSKHV
jgi:hypothetical protein